MTTDTNLIPDAPDQTSVAIVAGMVRGVLQLASGAGFMAGAYTDSQITMFATLLVAGATLLWSGYQKLQAARKNRSTSAMSARLSADASAQAGAPVPIVITATKEAQP